jgi:hypothetical protein
MSCAEEDFAAEILPLRNSQRAVWCKSLLRVFEPLAADMTKMTRNNSLLLFYLI